jgi:hypothetical protein
MTPERVLIAVATLAVLSWMVPPEWKFHAWIRGVLFLAALMVVALALAGWAA